MAAAHENSLILYAKIGGPRARTRNRLRQVEMIPGVTYRRIDDEGLHITVVTRDNAVGEDRVLAVDNVILCAGQLPLRTLYDELQGSAFAVHLVGGADVAAELVSRPGNSLTYEPRTGH